MPRTNPAEYATKTQVRKLATFIPVKDLSDSDVTPYLEAAMDTVDRETGRTGTYWIGTEENFGIVSYVTALFAAAALQRHYGAASGMSEAIKAAESLEKLAEEELEKLTEVGSDTSIDADVPSASTGYSTYEAARMEDPTQTVVTPYRSTDFV